MMKRSIVSTVISTVILQGAHAATIEEVVVTAQKRSQSLQDVGISISAFSENDVRDLGLNDIDNLAAAVPNLQGLDDAAGLTSFRIRGIGLNEFQAAFDSPVGVHLDEVFLSKPMLASMGFFDVERIEVLKGPQGTVFGRNTTGGAVNYYSNKPTDEFEAGVKLNYGRFERLESEAYINGPLTDSVSARVAVQLSDHGSDGPYENLFDKSKIGDMEQRQVRAQLLWSNEQTSALLAAQFGSKKGDMIPYDNLFQDQPGGTPDVTKDIRNPIGRYTVNQDYNPTTDSETSSLSIRIDHDVELGTITSSTAFKTFERDNREDSDNTPIISTNIDWYSDIDQFTQELRLTGETDNWNYLFGAYYEYDELQTVETVDVSDVWRLGLSGFAQLGADHNIETTSYAIYTSHEYALSDELNLTVGARYTEEKNQIIGQSFLTTSPAETFGREDRVPSADQVILVNANNSRTDSDFNYKLGINYFPTEDLLLYGSYSTGFRSGGYDLAFGAPSLESFEPEEMKAVEVGFKSTLLDNSLTFNGAAFYAEIDNYQTNVNLAGELVPRRRNVGSLETSGLEFDLKWQAAEQWRIIFSGGYTQSEIVKAARDINGTPFAVDGVPIEGNRPPNTPQWSFSGLTDYTLPLNEHSNLHFLLSASWTDERYLELENGADHLVDAYTTVDANIAWAAADEQWRFSLWGKNIFDEQYIRYLNDVPAFGLFLVINAAPATYGISFDYNF